MTITRHILRGGHRNAVDNLPILIAVSSSVARGAVPGVATPLLGSKSVQPLQCRGAEGRRTLGNCRHWARAGGYIFSRLQVAETLIATDKQGALASGLTESWAVSHDGLIWTFTLRDNAVFHDGTPVTAETATESFKRSLAGIGVLPQAPIAEIAGNGATVRITLSKPFSVLLAYVVHLSTIALALPPFDAAGKALQIVGWGPKKVKALTPPARLELAASGAW